MSCMKFTPEQKEIVYGILQSFKEVNQETPGLPLPESIHYESAEPLTNGQIALIQSITGIKRMVWVGKGKFASREPKTH